MVKRKGPSLRKLRRALRGAGPLGAVAFGRAAVLLDCPLATVQVLIDSGAMLTVRVRGERRVPLSEIRRCRR
jgi:hypothetical protein